MFAMQSKQMRARLFLILGAFSLTAGCASSHRSTEPVPAAGALPNEPVAMAADTLSSCKAWELSLHAHISHISAAQNGTRLLISTSSEKQYEAMIRFTDKNGRVLWMKGFSQPVKAQAIAHDASVLAVNTYDGLLQAFNSKGKKLWQKEHLGRPVVLTKSKRVLLLNDDDSEPTTAFISYDFSGKLKAQVEMASSNGKKREPLDAFVADDESAVAVTTTDNSLLLYTPDGKLLSEAALPGT